MKKAKPDDDILENLSLKDLSRFCGADEAWIVELVEHGVLDPVGSASRHWRFHGTSIARAKKASRLGRDLGINTAGVALILELLQEREDLLHRLARYEKI